MPLVCPSLSQSLSRPMALSRVVSRLTTSPTSSRLPSIAGRAPLPCPWRSVSQSTKTAAYCHFGRKPYTKEGRKYFEWENAKDLSKYKPMNSEQVTAELKASNYLTKWVD